MQTPRLVRAAAATAATRRCCVALSKSPAPISRATAAGRTVDKKLVTANTGVKLESFIFDCFVLSTSMAVRPCRAITHVMTLHVHRVRVCVGAVVLALRALY